MNELKTRGVGDVLIAVVDGLKGFPDAIEAVFPQATVQTCLVHLIRRSLAYVSYKERRALAAALKTIYRAPTEAAAQTALEAPRGRCVGSEVPGHHAQLAQRLGTRGALPSLLAADPACDLHHQRNREPQQHGAPGGAHPGPLPQRPRRGEADLLALRRLKVGWRAPPLYWHQVRPEFAIRFGERFVVDGS